VSNKTIDKPPEGQELKNVIEYLREIMQQAQFSAINISIAAKMIGKNYGRQSELGKALNDLATKSSDATSKIEELSKLATEGLNSFDYSSFKKRYEFDLKTLREIENSFSLMMADIKRVVNLLKRLNPEKQS